MKKEFMNGDVTNARLISEDGKYYVQTGDTKVECLKVVPYQGRHVIYLPENESNRKYFDTKKADEAITANGFLALTYKATRTNTGGGGKRLPNAKLIEYLPEKEQAEYKALIEKATKLYEEVKNKPLTEEEKLMRTIERAQAKLEALKADNKQA